MMKYKLITAMFLATAMMVAGCAGQNAAPTDAAQETGQNSEVPEGVIVEYESPNGWNVSYDDSVIDVEESKDGVSFFYTGKSDGVNEITFNYFMNRMPDEVLYDAIATEEGLPEHTRSEDYFAGRDDVWSMRVSVAPTDDTSNPQEFIAVEHNGGTLLIQVDTHKEEDEENGIRISDTLMAILESFTFTDHEEQTYSAYVPGKYVAEVTDEVDGESVSAEYYVELNKDHTGVVSMQDEVPVFWYSREGILLNADTDEQIYEYVVEGDMLYLTDRSGEEPVTFEFARQQ